jgi:hypothetical protein
MDVTTFTITVFCLIDDWLASQSRPLRRRGPAPTLADSEVLTIECVGEFLGIDTDSGLYQYFRRHWADWFPALRRVHRTTFLRQAANLWAVKHRLHRTCWPRSTSTQPSRWSIAWPCRSAGSPGPSRCRRLRELAAWGHDEVAKQPYLGLRAHLRVCWPGVIVDGRLAPANLSDLAVGEELLAGVGGWTLADRNYGSPRLAGQLQAKEGGCWPHPGGNAARGSGHRPGWLANAAGSRRSSAS